MVELLVSMVLGLVVVGAVVVTYTSSGSSGARQNALAQMGEDAQLAFSLLSRDLQMAGYSEPTAITVAGGAGSNATFTKKYTGRPLFGCVKPMVNASIALAGGLDAVTCSLVGSSTNHSLVVNYEGTTQNTVLNAAGNPTNCLGSDAAALGVGAGAYKLVSNRYYIANSGTSGRPELHCAGPGVAGQPLVENVEVMNLWMGQAVAASPRRPVRYVAPDQVAAGDWGTIIAVRICLLMRSADPVLTNEDTATYRDCSGAEATSADRRLRRAFYSTVALRNKTAF